MIFPSFLYFALHRTFSLSPSSNESHDLKCHEEEKFATILVKAQMTVALRESCHYVKAMEKKGISFLSLFLNLVGENKRGIKRNEEKDKKEKNVSGWGAREGNIHIKSVGW